MSKRIDYGRDAFKKLLSGAEQLSNAVATTLGAKGQNVLIEGLYENDPPHITKDGITVAKAVQLKDPVERIASNLMRSVSQKTNIEAGDGSSTSVVLANAILQYGAAAIDEGHSPVMLKRGIDIEAKNTIDYLNALTTPLEGDMEMAYKVALVSANGDERIAKLVTDVYTEVGVEGNVAIEPDINSPEISYQKVEGLEFDRGFNHPYFITDIPTETVEYNDPLILISDYHVMHIKELKTVLMLAQDLGRPLVIICEDLDPEADNMLAVNKLQNGFPVVTIKAPEFGDRRLNFLEDLATVTGGTFISTVTGKTYDDVVESDFGRCGKIFVTRETTSIIAGHGPIEKVEERLDSILNQLQNAKNDEHKSYLEKRYAKLKGGVVVIKVGANSDVERVEIKDRVEDAVNAVKSALIDGIIPGGGTALLRISLTPIVQTEGERKDIEAGRAVLKKALKIPFNQIMFNAGYRDNISEFVETLIKSGANTVFNVISEDFEDGIEGGIIDPVLVTKSALKNASSVAGTLITTGCTISFEPNEDTTLKL